MSQLAEPFAKLTGRTVITVPSKFNLPKEYRGIGLETVTRVWGIDIASEPASDNTCRLILPKGWVIEYPANPLWVKDTKGSVRMSLASRSVVFIDAPVQTHINGDEKVGWVEVLHRGKEVFRSSAFTHEDLPQTLDTYEVMMDVYLVLQPYYDEAEAFVQKHYPLLHQDPNAYW